ncbi:hypothetical protein RRF57_006959 [Xylaria bambusicola]|uniref:Uncharacterized protein n=1 Tax=Xylaria bambusicola TaxID=326684 RepID=A0AAN7UFD9_9PEZI
MFIPYSSPQGRRKIIRKLLVKLKHIQADDFPIPNPTIFEIKFYLKANRRCCTVFVQNTDTLFYKLPPILLELAPRFITSQLEAQKIADKYRQSVQLSTVLAVLSEYIVADPIRTNSVPTLFFWYDTNKRRTFYLFAYLTHQMEPRTYSAAELLGLRRSQTSETCHSVLARLKADPEFDEVVSKGNINPTQVRAARKPKEVSSSSNESDEVIYRGKNHPRHPSQPIPPSANLQWKYRGRTGSEVTSSDPLPAPTGLDKQSSEGFQRFFKAVVSPTHVRVTAGGRIVPNTRNSVSPTTKWDKERLPNDVQNAADRGKELKTEPIFAPLNNQIPPMVQPMYQPQPIVYQHMGMPIPIYHPLQGPVQHGFAYPYGFAPLAAPIQRAPYLPMPECEQRAEVIGAMSKQNGSGENDNRSYRAPIKLSPPDQFDQNRPFYINGQLVFPTGGMGPGQMPQVVPSHYFASGFLPASGPSVQRIVAGNNPNSTISLAPEANAPSPQLCSSAPDRGTPSQQSTTAAGPLPGTMPPLSSIRPSEITRKQLDGLRHQLKFYISQLQFNRHQIDEPWVFAQAQKVRDNIKQFEHNLQMHIRFEMEHYPNMEPTPRHISEMAMPCNTPSRPPSIRHTQASGSSHHGSVRSSGATSGPGHFQAQQTGIGGRGCPKPNRAAVGINSNRTDNSTAHIDALEAAVIQKLSAPDATPEQKAMLEAITRPLNPHHDPKPFVNQQYSSDNSSLKSFSAQPPPFAEKKASQGQAPSTEIYLQNQRVQHTGTYHANGNMPYMAPGNGDGLRGPYLVGNCPPGTDPWTYLGHEFVYGRELTEAEKQARNVYWGKLPSKGTGLPKFDGKDFYPASPQKIAEQAGQIRNVSSRRPEIDPGFELRRFEVDPFGSTRDANSIRSFESGRKLSKAIPIVAPPDMDKKATSHLSTPNTVKSGEGIEGLNKLNQSLQGLNLSSTDETHAKYPEKKKSPSLGRRALERSRYVGLSSIMEGTGLIVSSVKSGHDLWQTMLKKGSASGNVLPGTISSTTATGYLPQYAGNAIASLGPTISNISPARVSPNADDKLVELEGPRVAMDKVGENCPPSSAPSIEHDITKDLHQRMLRDAERRGVIGSDWQ